MKYLVLSFLVCLPSFVIASPVGYATIQGKVISYNKKWVYIKNNGKKMKLPRAVAKGDSLHKGSIHTFTLNQNQLNLAILRSQVKKKR